MSMVLPIPALFFYSKKAFTRFIWNNKHPCLRLSLIYLPYDRGSFNCQIFNSITGQHSCKQPCFIFRKQIIQPGLILKRMDYRSHYTHILYVYSAQFKTLKDTLNPFLRNTMQVWYEAHSFLEETITTSVFSPILGNNDFIPKKE